MKRRPSAAHTWGPDAFLKNTGSPPTPRKARTGELTPPGMYLQASSNRLKDYSHRVSRAGATVNSDGGLGQAQTPSKAPGAIAGTRAAAVGPHHLGGDGEANAFAAA